MRHFICVLSKGFHFLNWMCSNGKIPFCSKTKENISIYNEDWGINRFCRQKLSSKFITHTKKPIAAQASVWNLPQTNQWDGKNLDAVATAAARPPLSSSSANFQYLNKFLLWLLSQQWMIDKWHVVYVFMQLSFCLLQFLVNVEKQSTSYDQWNARDLLILTSFFCNFLFRQSVFFFAVNLIGCCTVALV